LISSSRMISISLVVTRGGATWLAIFCCTTLH
jgi:hypothetical protein